MKYRLKHVVEYAFLRATAGLANVLPHRAALFVGWIIAAAGWVLLRGRMRKIEARIRQAFGDAKPPREVRRIAWLAWRNLCFNGVEAMRTPSTTLDWVKKVTDHTDIRMVFDHMKDGRGVVLAVPHMGNWELAGVAAQMFGAKIMIIVRKQKNPLANAYLNRMREFTGVQAFLREQKSLAGIARGLREGKVLAILPDLRAKADFIPCRFLGRDAVQIPAGMAHFAREAGVPVIPAYVVREGWGRHRWKGFPPIVPDPSLDREADFKRMTQYVIDCFDQAIREHPDQYFWFNQRWVLGDG
jgi:Kdo2-lipid IVA lauroyltransferase/acyltransferase